MRDQSSLILSDRSVKTGSLFTPMTSSLAVAAACTDDGRFSCAGPTAGGFKPQYLQQLGDLDPTTRLTQAAWWSMIAGTSTGASERPDS